MEDYGIRESGCGICKRWRGSDSKTWYMPTEQERRAHAERGGVVSTCFCIDCYPGYLRASGIKEEKIMEMWLSDFRIGDD